MFIDEINIEVQRKKIKRLHLHVRPDTSVYISAPYGTDNNTIKEFAQNNIQWIRDTIGKYKSLNRPEPRKYETGESVCIFGEKYDLVFVPGNGKSFYIKDNKAYLIMCPQTNTSCRIGYMREVFRHMLEEKIGELFPKWENITGLNASEIRTKYMRTRWGTCNYRVGRIWLSLMLVQHPVKCIEYVILHELIHLRVPNHGPDFQAEMDKYMPEWRDIKQQLNKPLNCII